MASVSLGDIVVFLKASVTNFTSGISSAVSALKQLTVAAVGAETGFASAAASLQKFTQTAFIGLAIVLAAVRPLTAEFGKFERQMSAVQAATETMQGATKEAKKEFADATALARELGATTRYSSTQAAEAMFELAKAGFDTKEQMASVKAVLDLAAAGQLEVARATEIAANVMRAFGLSAASMTRVVDVLSLAAQESTTSVEGMGVALSYASPLASALGMSIEETAAAIAVLANAGIDGSTAGTSLNGILSHLVNVSNKAEKALARYGLTVDDVNPQVFSFTEILQKFINAGVRASDVMEIMDVRAGRSFLTYMNQGVPALDKMTGKMNDAALATVTMASVMEYNLIGVVNILKARFDHLLTSIEGVKNSSTGLVTILKGHLVNIIQLISKIDEWAVANEKIVGIIGNIIITVTAAVAAFVPLFFVLKAVWLAIAGVAALIGGIFSVAFLKLAVVAAAVAIVVVPVIEVVRDKIKELGITWNDVFEYIKALWESFASGFKDVYTALAPVFAELKASLKEFIDLISGSVKSGDVETLANALGRVAAAIIAIFAALEAGAVRALSYIIDEFNQLRDLILGTLELLERLNFKFKQSQRNADPTAFLPEQSDARTARQKATDKFQEQFAPGILKRRLEVETARRDENLGEGRDFFKSTVSSTALRGKAIELLNTASDLTPKQLEELAAIQNSVELTEKAVEAALKTVSDYKKFVEDANAKVVELGGTVSQEADLDRRHAIQKEADLKLQLDAMIKLRHEREALNTLISMGEGTEGDKKRLAVLTRTAEENLKLAAIEQRKNELANEAKKAQGELIAIESKLQTIRDAVNESTLEGHAKELEALDNEYEARVKLLTLAQENQSLMMRNLSENAGVDIGGAQARYWDLRAKATITDAENIEAEKLAAFINAYAKMATEYVDTQAIQDALAEKTAEHRKKILEKSVKDELELVREKDIQLAKMQKNEIRVAELEAKKYKEIEEDKNQVILAQAAARSDAELEIAKKRVEQARRISEQVADDMVASVRKKIEEDKKDFELDARIADFKSRGDTLNAAEAEGDKFLEIERRKNAEYLRQAEQLGKDEFEIAKKRIARKEIEDLSAAAVIRREAEKDVFGLKSGVIGAAEREVATEIKITDQLLTQVKSLQDMFALYQAIFYIRNVKEQMAAQAAMDAITLEEKAVALRERANNAPGNRKLDVAARRAEEIARLGRNRAGVREGEAGLRGGDPVGAKAEGIRVTAEIQATLDNLIAQIKLQTTKFRETGIEYMTALDEGIQAGIPMVTNAIAIVSERIIGAFSIFAFIGDEAVSGDQWFYKTGEGWIAALADGINNAIPIVVAAAINMAAAVQDSLGGLVVPGGASSPMDDAAGVPAGGGIVSGNLVDARSVEVNVNNNVDVGNVMRHLGDAIETGLGYAGAV